MPFVRISLKEGRSAEDREAIADCVHTALVEAIGIPVDDRFQVVTEYGSGGVGSQLFYNANYLGVQRTDGIVFVQIFLRKGRSVEAKKALYLRVVDLLSERVKIRPEDVLITLSENDAADWSFGNGIAQYA
ncbi:putative tautomerase [Acidisarcina polymorpha]|uniref:Putative tautomerase n=1 Tax=Acidisarcina polymorpha TaxID=2211140 RepID=A0A2Z5GA74_9BACT|nr:tautomerase family protein [Acidisarcina polymorpha]AXC15908.1 putative tautomerase [Acidisarcina polymorpha]